jgi:hypothetical protein
MVAVASRCRAIRRRLTWQPTRFARTRYRPSGASWFPDDVEAWSVRWVFLHLISELARHAGHADIIRESIDGATMRELVAASD